MLLSMLAVLSACGGEEPLDPSAPGPRQDATADATGAEADIQDPTVLPLSQTQVSVYFPSSSGDGLVAESHEIFETTTPGDRAKQIVADLIEGPRSGAALRAVPRGTHLRQVYVLRSGVAYLDFSRELVEGLGGGSMLELLTVYAIVDSVTRNIPEIKSVGLLIEGNIPDTLNGHLDLRYPLRPDYSMVLETDGSAAGAAADPPVRVAGNP